METPQNIVPMPAEQRAQLKRLAEAASPAPWVAHISELRSRVRCATGHSIFPDAAEPDAHYIAAVSPDVALAILAYVEALEAKITTLEAAAATARGELAEREAEIEAAHACFNRYRRTKDSLVQTATKMAEGRTHEFERADRAEAQLVGLRGAYAGQRTNWLEQQTQQAAALQEAEHALAGCYDVTEWPANGRSEQDAALSFVRRVLYSPAQSAPKPAAAPPQEGEAAEPEFITCIHEGCQNGHVHDGHCACYLLGAADEEERLSRSISDENAAPALPLEGKAAAPTYEEYLAAAEKSGMLSTAHIETWDRLSRAGQRQLIEHAQNWTQPVDAEGKPLEFREGGYWNE